MNIEELRKAYEAATPGEWEAGEDCDACYVWPNPKDDFLAELGMNGGCDASFIALSHNAFPALLKAIELLPVARDLIAEAMDNHIYSEADGEVPGEDCQYVAFLKEADAVLKGVENA